MIAYVSGNSPSPGYGPRIFIPYAHTYPQLVAHLNKKSQWSGADKDTGVCKSWEFTNDTIGELRAYLVGYGFRVENCSSANERQVWA